MSKFRLINFWSHNITTAEDTWFARFIRHRFKSHPDVLLSSVLGPLSAIRRQEEEFWIHYSGENTFERYPEYGDHCSIEADLILDFWPESRPNAIRFPIWLWYFFEPTWELPEIKATILQAENQKANVISRPISLAMVDEHEGFYGCPRVSMVKHCADSNLELYSEGRYARNSAKVEREYANDRQAYLKDVAFYFCPENSQTIGYTTEKLFSGVLNGSIPIYWGSGGVPEFDILNQHRIIKIEDKGVQGAIACVEEMLRKPAMMTEFANQPIFKSNAAECILGHFEAFERMLEQTGRFEK